VAGISWIRVMCWNPREPRPIQRISWHLLQISLHACQKCMQKCLYASISLIFIPFVLNIPWTYSYKSYVFIFGAATFWRVNYVTNLAPKN
jgi:translation initiation factor RLI1